MAVTLHTTVRQQLLGNLTQTQPDEAAHPLCQQSCHPC